MRLSNSEIRKVVLLNKCTLTIIFCAKIKYLDDNYTQFSPYNTKYLDTKCLNKKCLSTPIAM